MHKHRKKTFIDRGYTGGSPSHRDTMTGLAAKATGGITRGETCACGAERTVNINGKWRDAGDWRDPPIDSNN